MRHVGRPRAALVVGMTSEEYAEEVASFIATTAARINGPGKAQYELGPDRQRFEGLSPACILEEFIEELDDAACYIVAARLRAGLMLRYMTSTFYEFNVQLGGTDD